jgi:peptide/nickel transport system permease protein
MAIAIPAREPRYWRARFASYAREARRLPLFAMAILLAVLIVPAIFAPFVAPHDPKDGDIQDRLLPPFWMEASTDSFRVAKGITADPGEMSLDDAQRFVRIGDATIVGGSEEVNVGDTIEIVNKESGSTKYILGTDKAGRDIFSRVIYGSRVSIMVALISIGIGAAVGTVIGITSGYFGGWTDSLLMRLSDISMSLPIVLVALLLVATVGPSFSVVITVLVLLMWARFARMVRGETLAIVTQDFVARARVAGASHFRIMRVHILPNLLNSLIVLSTLWVAFVILLEATLTFLGAGIPRPTPAWGLMVSDGRELVFTEWWVALFPGIAILLVCMSMNLLGDWLRDRLDPKLRQV